jgi:hypothetical protein
MLRHPHVEPRIKELVRDDVRAEVTREHWQSLLEGNIWVFTCMKSGTTYLLNAIAAYRSLEFAERDFDFDTIHHYGVIRGLYPVQLARLIDFSKNGARVNSLLFHTHRRLDARFERAVLLTRNPYDFVVSSYNFHYKRRRGRERIRFEEALPRMLGEYADVHRAQREIIANSNRPVLDVSYEEFLSDPPATFARVLEFLGETVEEERLLQALEMCSVERLKEHEKRNGKAVVAASSYLARHFVRSGRIGEYESELGREQLELVDEGLTRVGLGHLLRETRSPAS